MRLALSRKRVIEYPTVVVVAPGEEGGYVIEPEPEAPPEKEGRQPGGGAGTDQVGFWIPEGCAACRAERVCVKTACSTAGLLLPHSHAC